MEVKEIAPPGTTDTPCGERDEAGLGATAALAKFPKHEASLHLTHNDHKSYYQTVEESIERGDHGYSAGVWVSAEQRQKAIDTNECWTLQWYPNTPVGFCMLSAADLDVLLAAASDEP